MSSYKVTFIDEILNKVYIDLSYLPEGEKFPSTLADYFDTDDFSLENVQGMSTKKLEEFIAATDAKLKPVKDSAIPPETQAIVGVEIGLDGKPLPGDEIPAPSPVVLDTP